MYNMLGDTTMPWQRPLLFKCSWLTLISQVENQAWLSFSSRCSITKPDPNASAFKPNLIQTRFSDEDAATLECWMMPENLESVPDEHHLRFQSHKAHKTIAMVMMLVSCAVMKKTSED